MWRHWSVLVMMVGALVALLAGIVLAKGWDVRLSVRELRWVLAAALFIAFASVWLSMLRVRRHQKNRNEKADEIRRLVLNGGRPSRPFFVYLRPFHIDGAFVEAPRTAADKSFVEKYGVPTAYHDLETALALLVHRHGDLVAVTDHAGAEWKPGAGHIQAPEDDWQEHVRALVQKAAGIFIVPFDRDGTAWEVCLVKELRLLDRVVFVMPAAGTVIRQVFRISGQSRDYRLLWEAGRARYSWLPLPEYDDRGAMLQINDGRASILAAFGGPVLRLGEIFNWRERRRVQMRPGRNSRESYRKIRGHVESLARNYCQHERRGAE